MIYKLSEMQLGPKPPRAANPKDPAVILEVGRTVTLRSDAGSIGRFGRVKSLPIQVRILATSMPDRGHTSREHRNGPTLLVEGVNCKGKTYLKSADVQGSGFNG